MLAHLLMMLAHLWLACGLWGPVAVGVPPGGTVVAFGCVYMSLERDACGSNYYPAACIPEVLEGPNPCPLPPAPCLALPQQHDALNPGTAR